ncbi:MAG: SH3 domain-containing protein, partial [Chloroflexota bacterium]|nr:SH3 domain-containing protein [Chloroflexota bacterium]
MPQGATVTVDGDPQNGFYRTVYAGTEGWASSSFLSLGGGGGGGATTGTATTTTSLNLRAGAGTGYSVLRVMPA